MGEDLLIKPLPFSKVWSFVANYSLPVMLSEVEAREGWGGHKSP
jgi:hypothetical protein